MSASHLRQKRLAPSAVRCDPVREGSLQLGQTTCRLDIWMGASRSRMPPCWFFPGFGLVCFLVKFTRSTMALPLADRTRSTRPCLPRSLPDRTTTLSPFLTCGLAAAVSFCFLLDTYMDDL